MRTSQAVLAVVLPAVGNRPEGSWHLRSQLNRRQLRALQGLLGAPGLSFLGSWRSNVSRLREVNARLAAGHYTVIEGFLAEEVAQAVLNETLQAKRNGWFGSIGTPMNRSFFAALRQASSPAEQCKLLYQEALQAPKGAGFRFKYNALDAPPDSIAALELPDLTRVAAGLSSQRWLGALAALLTGSDQDTGGARFDAPNVREFLPGDHVLFHNDMKAFDATRRTLCLNYWFPSSLWKPEWGGNFLWCGAPAASNLGITFPSVSRVTPAFNRANLFVPGTETWHAVEPVQASKEVSCQRFAFTSWLNIPFS
eukprot:TRINITY_DN20726_c0_g1_i1.p1 TRINITY_DN20726_c0_g1~~TRINITY_DN20726_c0_g1_i1.p1  ORF type:complete len:310 (+),score=50.13 TRINITY_DN20726_c0_g1_i1:115-1044(+)